MAGFIRIRNCCCCGGSLKGASITIGVFYLLVAVLGVVAGNNDLWSAVNIDIYNPSVYGPCEENFFLPLLSETSIISGIVNLLMLYGIITSRSSFIAPWLAWNIAYPFIQLAHIIWSITILATCDFVAFSEFNTTVIVILTCNALSLAFLLYFAIVIYSQYKDIQEEEKKSGSYGTRILMPSKNWDEELSPYTSYDPSVATPMSWGTLPPPPSSKGPAPPPPVHKSAGIPRPHSNTNYNA